MKEGTKSYLFGCHQFIMHPLLIVLAWKVLYNQMPTLKQIVCIFLHDIGHLGKNYLTHLSEKEKHWILGAKIAKFFFGEYGFWLVYSHHARVEGGKSKLFYADKYSWLIAPRWWLRLNDKVEGFDKYRPLDEWLKRVKENFENGCPKGTHDIYLEMRDEMSKQSRV